jgi:hypothetical protein
MMRGTSFVVRFESTHLATAQAAARALDASLAARGLNAPVESGTRQLPGTTLVVGVRDLASDGTPRWLAPLLVRDDPQAAAADAIAFLERWGFVTRVADAAATAASATSTVRVT